MENEPPSASQVSAIPPWGDKTWKWNLEHKKLLYLGKSKFFWYDPARIFFLSVMRSFLWGQWRLWWLFYQCCWIHHLHCKPALVSSNWSISSILEKRQGEVKSYLSTMQDQLLPTSSADNDNLHSVSFVFFCSLQLPLPPPVSPRQIAEFPSRIFWLALEEL